MNDTQQDAGPAPDPRRSRAIAIALAVSLSALTVVILWRGLPPQIDGLKKVVVVALAGAVNLSLALVVLSGGPRDAELHPLDEAPDGEPSDAPAVVAGMKFSDPSALAFALLIAGASAVVLIPSQGVIGAARIAIGGLLFLAPGYLVSILLLPMSQGVIGRLLFSAVFSAAFVPLVAQVMYWFGFLFTTWIALIATVGLALALLAVVKYAPALRSARAGRRTPAAH